MCSYLKHLTRWITAGAIITIVGLSIGTLPAFADGITPPAGNRLFLVGHAIGTQGYTCLPSATGGVVWTSKPGPSRPEATLFSPVAVPFPAGVKQIITHFLSPNPLEAGNPRPTWQSSIDSSIVWGKKVASIDAGSDPTTCPNSGAIPCLLLQVVGAQAGPTGGTQLSDTTWIQRLNTSGGTAPATGPGTACDATVSATIGNTALVPYTADYYFYQ